MPNQGLNSAAKVGVLVIGCGALMIGGYAVLGKSLFAPPVDVYYADLEDVSGVTPGTPVLVAGVPVGTVGKLSLLDPYHARLTLQLEKGTHIPVGTEAVIPTSLIGVGISPVTLKGPAGSQEFVPVGTILTGRRASALEGAIPNAGKTMEEMTKTVTALRKLLEDPKFKENTRALLSNSNKMIKGFGDLAENTNATLLQNQAQINSAMVSVAHTVANVDRITVQLARLMESGKIQRNTEAIMANMQSITARTDKLVSSLDRLVNDPKLRGNSAKIAENVAEITSTSKAIAKNAEEMSKQGISITKNVNEITKNGIGISENVKTITEKAITLTDHANELAKGAVEIEGKVKGTLDKVGGFFNKGQGKGPLNSLQSQIDLLRETEPNRWRTDVSFMYPLPDNKLYFGIFDAFEANRLIVQFGKPVNSKLDYRYGIYASKPGVGVDSRLTPKISFRGDLFDINSPRLDLRLKYEFGGGLHGWIGADRVLRENALTLGFGVRK